MTQSIASILEKLQQSELCDRIFARPLQELELDLIEEGVGLKMPRALREILRTIGIRQDLIIGHTSDIMWMGHPGSFASTKKDMLEMFGEITAALFPLGDDGAGNFYALDTSIGEGDTIVFVDHEVNDVSPYKQVNEWFEEVIAKATIGWEKRKKNNEKELVVSFAFQSSQLSEVVALISEVCVVHDLDGEWRDRDECESFVKSSTGGGLLWC